ncbi:MAG: AAA family ATPase, partial [Solirubrobacteraceae bacterium]
MSAQPDPGTVLAGRYEVVRRQADGTLLGRDTATMASVTITAAEAGLVSADAAGLIAREVTDLERLPGLATPLFAGRDGGWFLLVTPLIRGVPLAERLAPGGLPLAAVLQVARDLLAALASAHSRGLLHLAISPATVMVNPDGAIRGASLAGFGGAALRDCIAGDPGPSDVRYAAPERAGVLDRPVDHRTDLYSIGLVLHECLTGRPAYLAGSDGELLRRRLTDRPPALTPERPEVPAALEAEILRMLAVDPVDRPADAAAALRALDPAGAPHSGPPRGAGPGALVGRDAELAALVARLCAARDGHGSAVLLEGAAGVGKTRLLEELCRLAAAEGATVLRGAAREYPPAPASGLDGVVDGLLALDPERLRAAVRGPAATSVCDLLPRLGPLLGVAAAPAHHRPSDPVRWSGAHALARLLAAAGRPGSPALIVLDDCQWADAAVLDLIAAWSAVAGARHASLIVGLRPRGLPDDHPLRQIAAIGRVAVGPLPDAAAAELARSAADSGDATGADFVAAAAAGNPARAALAASGLRDARVVPGRVPSPEDVASWRLELLPDEVRKLLGAGALLGREFSLDLAAAMLGRGDTWTELARAGAERRRLVVRSGPEERRLTFCHDDLRQAVLASISPGDRRRLHARARDVLAPDGGDVYATAWHALASGDPERAVPRAMAAARAATGRQALDVAEHYLREARQAAAGLPTERTLEIVEDLAAVYLAQGRTDLAEEQLSAAARTAREPARRTAIGVTLARLDASRGDHTAATPAAEAAIQSRGERHPGASPVALVVLLAVELLAHLRVRRRRRRKADPAAAAEYLLLARCYAGAGRRAGAVWAALRALHLAEAAGYGPLLADCQGGFARVLREAGFDRRALVVARRAVTAAAGLGDLAAGRAVAVEGELLYGSAQYADAADCFARAAGLLGEAAAPDEADAAILWGGFCDYRAARVDEARGTAAGVRRRALGRDAGKLAAAATGLSLKA